MALFSLYASRDGHPVGAPSSIALFFRGCAAWILAAKGRREAPSPASVPWIRRKDESWAADRSRRRFATFDNDRACTTVKFRRWWARHYQEWHARSARYSANAFLSIEGPRVGWNSEIRNPKCAIWVYLGDLWTSREGGLELRIPNSEFRIRPHSISSHLNHVG